MAFDYLSNDQLLQLLYEWQGGGYYCPKFSKLIDEELERRSAEAVRPSDRPRREKLDE